MNYKLLLKQTIGSGAYWTVNKKLTHETSSLAAIILAELLGRQDMYEAFGEWFYLENKELQEIIGVGYDCLKTAIAKLKAKGFIETDIKGMPRKCCYKINHEAIFNFFNTESANENNNKDEETQDCIKEKPESVLGKTHDCIKEKPTTVLRKNQKSSIYYNNKDNNKDNNTIGGSNDTALYKELQDFFLAHSKSIYDFKVDSHQVKTLIALSKKIMPDEYADFAMKISKFFLWLITKSNDPFFKKFIFLPRYLVSQKMWALVVGRFNQSFGDYKQELEIKQIQERSKQVLAGVL